MLVCLGLLLSNIASFYWPVVYWDLLEWGVQAEVSGGTPLAAINAWAHDNAVGGAGGKKAVIL